jgi:hypothetical protein
VFSGNSLYNKELLLLNLELPWGLSRNIDKTMRRFYYKSKQSHYPYSAASHWKRGETSGGFTSGISRVFLLIR